MVLSLESLEPRLALELRLVSCWLTMRIHMAPGGYDQAPMHRWALLLEDLKRQNRPAQRAPHIYTLVFVVHLSK